MSIFNNWVLLRLQDQPRNTFEVLSLVSCVSSSLFFPCCCWWYVIVHSSIPDFQHSFLLSLKCFCLAKMDSWDYFRLSPWYILWVCVFWACQEVFCAILLIKTPCTELIFIFAFEICFEVYRVQSQSQHYFFTLNCTKLI